ncbi:TlpA disulfide reductase family protein [Bartonella ancashensis]|uniref:Thiol:disulfide oxidoreductase TlpA n=1 Tax=Bartonella ancashensis TaxID=1318743 RepID=A0A0M3T2P8_9HYPH|nr:TlpA disulfide reductase family protein [Bartonella ancashensis]ALE03221.1 Thiol:disulfide oxidoreductase TlpA [Bartonella ancashensis]
MILKFFTDYKNKKIRLFIATLIIAPALYAIINNDSKKSTSLPNFISEEKAQKPNPNKIKIDEITAAKKAAKGFFSNLRFADNFYDATQLSFKDSQEKDHTLSEFTGKPMLVNIWAIWCMPCRAEMPELAQLQREMGGDNFDVIAINIDHSAPFEKIQNFLRDVNADNLIYYRDKTTNILKILRKQGLAFGLPVTLLLNKDGHLIASFNGAAPWANDDAKALIRAVIEKTL